MGRIAFAVVLMVAGIMTADAGEIRIKNCVGPQGSRVIAYGYNQGDTIYTIAYSQVEITHASTGAVKE